MLEPKGAAHDLARNLCAFQAVGGGDTSETLDMHKPKPTFQQGLQSFIRNSKAYIKLAGTNSTKQAVQAYQGSEMLMSRMGIFMRAPAINISLCLAPEGWEQHA